MFKNKLALFTGKITNFLVSFSKSGGTAAPGLVALKIDQNFLKKASKKLKFSILITGTNGKTTTARMLSFIFKQAKTNFIHNRTGSNLLRGVASQMIKENYQNKIGLWEIDEAVFPYALQSLKPKIVILNNLFRDQLDRYGEINTLAQKWKKSLKQLNKNTIVIANADDPNISAITKNLNAKVVYYGINNSNLGSKKISHANDADLCPYCSASLKYQSCFVSHLGIYNCPQCGNIQPKKDIYCSYYQQKNIFNNLVEIQSSNSKQKIKISLKISGIYNIYNLLASYAAAKELKINQKDIANGFKNFKPAFGRFEKIKIKHKNLYILLVKNPTGYNQVLKTLPLIAKNKKCSLLLSLNDQIADGTDISWIWDVDFNLLNKLNLDKIFISGTRKYDLSLRLKYEEIKTQTATNQQPAINNLINQTNKTLFILPTYTAMLEIRKNLFKKELVHKTWED